MVLDEIDHSAPGGRVYDIPFTPSSTLATVKPEPPPKTRPAPSPSTGSLTMSAGVFVRTYEDGRPPVSWSLDTPEPKTGSYRGYLCR